MMGNLFSIFDPCSKFNFNWMVFLFFFLMPWSAWKLNSFWLVWVAQIMYMISDELKSKLANSFKVEIMFVGVFFMFFWMNFMSLVTYVFCGTSHIAVNFSMSLIFWLSFMVWGYVVDYKHMFMHMVPLQSPLILAPLLVIIENVSNFIRPVTLAVRLMANMVAGHVILSLMSSASLGLDMMLSTLVILTQLPFMFLEMFVSFIQAYVFMMLLVSYWSEVGENYVKFKEESSNYILQENRSVEFSCKLKKWNVDL